MADFTLFLPKLLKHEGGFVNDPVDPGGATNKGITLRTFRQLRPHATTADLKNISNADVAFIYKNWYWDKIYGDNISNQNLAELIADHAVNAGVPRAVKMLQYLLNTYFQQQLVIDGIMGQRTWRALESAPTATLHNLFLQLRKNYYYYRAGVRTETNTDTAFLNKQLNIAPAVSQQKFVRGWIRRAESFPIVGISGAVLFFGALLAYLLFKK